MHFFVAFHINCEEKIDNVTLCILNIGAPHTTRTIIKNKRHRNNEVMQVVCRGVEKYLHALVV